MNVLEMMYVDRRDMWGSRIEDLVVGERESTRQRKRVERRQLKRTDRVRDLLFFQPLTTVHLQHFLPIKAFLLIIHHLAFSIDHVQSPLTQCTHTTSSIKSAVSLAFMHEPAYSEQKCLPLRSMSLSQSLQSLVSSVQLLLYCQRLSLSPLRQHYLDQ